VSSQQGSHSLESVNRVVDDLHSRVEVHCLNVSGGSVGICKNSQFFFKLPVVLVLWKSAEPELTLQSPCPQGVLQVGRYLARRGEAAKAECRWIADDLRAEQFARDRQGDELDSCSEG
jgi:hypothetical protein